MLYVTIEESRKGGYIGCDYGFLQAKDACEFAIYMGRNAEESYDTCTIYFDTIREGIASVIYTDRLRTAFKNVNFVG